MSAAPEFPPVVYIPARARSERNAHVVRLAALHQESVRVLPAPRPVTSIFDRPDRRPATDSLSVRLTARGRVVLGVATALVALTVVVVAWLSAPASAGVSPSDAGSLNGARSIPAAVVVQPGDSLWSIAQRLVPNGDPRPVVARLERLNKLPDGAQVVPGQHLRTR